MTVSVAPAQSSESDMTPRRDRCRGCRAIADDIGEFGTCLICSLKASIAVCSPKPQRPRRIPQPLSLEAQLRQSIHLVTPVAEDPWP